MLIGVAGAVFGSQGPGYTLQYMQNLQGAIDVLVPIVEKFDADVESEGYTRSEAFAECRLASEILETMCGGYERSVDRLNELSIHLAELEDAGDLSRPLILARSFDPEIVSSVQKQFAPAIPTTADGGIYAAGGFGASWGLSRFVFGLLGAMFGRSRFA